MTMRKSPAAKPAFLALSCVGILASAPALAAGAEAAGDAGSGSAATTTSDDGRTIVVNAQKSELELESPKTVAPLLDTPQTVTVISDQTLRKQNLLTLRDALQTIPGITFGAGEGGGGYGDAINLRGYSANTDITVDGVRDSAQYSRTDPFNLQQIEVYNGANSVYSGSGSVGGTINLVSKTPQADNLTIVQGSIGTDDYYRGTVDTNLRLGEQVAFRLNAMAHKNDVPGRDVEKFERWGIAPSVTLGIDGPTSLTLAYYHQHDNNTPIYGVPYFKNELNDGPLAEIDDSDYFGIANLDEQKTTVDRLTATFKHSFSDRISVRNQTRYQRVAQYSQTSAPQGTFCLTATGLQPIATYASVRGGAPVGQPCTASIQNAINSAGVYYGNNNPTTSPTSHSVVVAPGFFQPNGPRGLVRDQLNTLFYNQTDLRVESGEKGGFHNTLVVGGALTWEDYSIESGSLIRNSAGQALILDPISMANPNTVYSGPINYTVTARSKSSTTNAAIYAFDNLEINEMFEINGGLRWESNKAKFRPIPLAVYPPGTAIPTAAELALQHSDEELFSWRVGGVFKPASNVSLYAAFADSKTPSSSTVRLGCTSGSGSSFVNFCDVAPETAKSYEVGVKADIGRVQLTGAVFRNDRTNFRVPGNDPSNPTLQMLDGRSRVDGVALGVTGYITPAWLVFGNYTYLNGRVKQSVSDLCLATPSVACLNSNTVGGITTTVVDPQAGDRLIQTPEHSGSLFTSYKFPFGLEIGYGLTYQGKFALNQRTLYGRTQFYSDDYITQRLLVSYEIREGLTAQLNVQNLFDEHYYTGIRNNIGTSLTGSTPNNGVITGGWATPGEARSAVFSLYYSF